MGAGKGQSKRVKNTLTVSLGVNLNNINPGLVYSDDINDDHPFFNVERTEHSVPDSNYTGSYRYIDSVRLEPSEAGEIFAGIAGFTYDNYSRGPITNPIEKELAKDVGLRTAVFAGASEVKEAIEKVTASINPETKIYNDYYGQTLDDVQILPEQAEMVAKIVDNKLDEIKQDYQNGDFKKIAVNFVKATSGMYPDEAETNKTIEKINQASNVSMKTISSTELSKRVMGYKAVPSWDKANQLFSKANGNNKNGQFIMDGVYIAKKDDAKKLLEMPFIVVEEYKNKSGATRYKPISNDRGLNSYLACAKHFNGKAEVPVIVIS